MKDPAVLFYISDWITSTMEMDADCRGWYLNLILHNFDKGSLPNDIEKLGVLCNVKFSEFERFKQVFEQVLKHKFEQTEDGRLTNGRTSTILKARESFKDKRSEAGKLSYFLKYCISQNKKANTEKFKEFVKDNLNIKELDTKNEQMLKQMFEHLFELYRSGNGNENKSIVGYEKEEHVLQNVYSYFDVKIIEDLKQKDKIAWLDEIRKLHELDKWSYKEIQDTIIWGRTDDFWKSNFASIRGLRKKNTNGISKFYNINQKMKNNGTGKQNKHDDLAEFSAMLLEATKDCPKG